MRRPAKLLTALLVVSAALGLIAWNTSAQTAPPALSVSDAKRQAADLAGTEVSVRGTVVEGSIVQDASVVVSFVVADSFERLRVQFGQTPPDNFGVKEVVVRGSLGQDAQAVVVLEAHSIQVGCSSKY